MLHFNQQSKIVFFRKPVNFHKGIDSLVHIIKIELGLELVPNLFILFCNRKRNRIKIILLHANRFILLSTRLEKTLKFKYQENVVFDPTSLDQFLNTTVTRSHAQRFKTPQN